MEGWKGAHRDGNGLEGWVHLGEGGLKGVGGVRVCGGEEEHKKRETNTHNNKGTRGEGDI